MMQSYNNSTAINFHTTKLLAECLIEIYKAAGIDPPTHLVPKEIAKIVYLSIREQALAHKPSPYSGGRTGSNNGL